MRFLLSVCCLSMIFLLGCTAQNQAELDAALSHLSGSVTYDPATGGVTGGIQIKDANGCDSTRSAVYQTRAAVNARDYGRVFNTAAEVRSVRAVTVTDAKALHVEKEILKAQARYDRKDVAENNRREQHNGSVALDYTADRSMYSSFIGVFGVHRVPHPLVGCAPITASAPVIIETNPPVTLPLPDIANGAPPAGVIGKDVTVQELARRVAALEDASKAMLTWMAKHP